MGTRLHLIKNNDGQQWNTNLIPRPHKNECQHGNEVRRKQEAVAPKYPAELLKDNEALYCMIT